MPSFSWVWNQKRKRKENTNKILKFSLENDFVFSFFFLSCLIQTNGRDSVRMHHKMPLIRSDPLSTVWPLAQEKNGRESSFLSWGSINRWSLSLSSYSFFLLRENNERKDEESDGWWASWKKKEGRPLDPRHQDGIKRSDYKKRNKNKCWNLWFHKKLHLFSLFI